MAVRLRLLGREFQEGDNCKGRCFLTANGCSLLFFFVRAHTSFIKRQEGLTMNKLNWMRFGKRLVSINKRLIGSTCKGAKGAVELGG